MARSVRGDLLLLSILALSFESSSWAKGKDLFVSPSGDDTDGSSWDKAFKRIQSASDVAGAGDVVRIDSGSYDGFTVSNKGITFRGEHRSDPPHVSKPSGEGVLIDGASATLQYLVVENCDSYGVHVNNGGPVKLDHVVLNDNGKASGTTNFFADGTVALTLEGVTAVGGTVELAGVVADRGGNGSLVENCVFVDSPDHGLYVRNYSGDLVIQNNTIVQDHDWCIRTGYLNSGVVLRNNILLGRIDAGALIVGQNLMDSSDYNLASMFNDGTNKTLVEWRTAHTNLEQNSRSANDINLVFVDLTKDYHLHDGSPAIDHGTGATGVPTMDIEGTARPQGTKWDMGAYEYVPRVPDAGLPGPDAETVQPDAEAVQVDASASDASLPADAGLADAGPAADTGSEADVGAAPDAGLVVTPDARPPGRDAEPTGKDVPYATAADGASAAYDLGGCGCGDPGAPGLAVGLSLLALLFRTARTSRRRP